MNSNLSQDLVDDPLHVDASDTQASILLQLLRDDEEVGGERPYERLRVMLRGVLALGQVCVYARPIPAERAGRWVSLDELRFAGDAHQLELYSRIDRSSDPQRLDEESAPVPLSSGERMFLNFGIRCAARVVPGTLLIMDEPETHLHPNLISTFMRILASLLADTQSVALIATHSPFVVRELPGRCVHIVELDSDRRPAINAAFLRTLGASVDQLSVDIFGDGGSEQLNRDLAAKLAGLGLTFDEIRQQYGRDISSDMLSEINELMTDASEGTGDHE
jgi:energy-coupling factor transporter ATP-binding protein EcfA2